MIKVTSLRYRKTARHWWAQVTAENQFKTATGSRQIPLTEKHAFSRAVQWAQTNAINQLKRDFV